MFLLNQALIMCMYINLFSFEFFIFLLMLILRLGEGKQNQVGCHLMSGVAIVLALCICLEFWWVADLMYVNRYSVAI